MEHHMDIKEPPTKWDLIGSLALLALLGGVFILLAVAAGTTSSGIWKILFYLFLIAMGAVAYHRFLVGKVRRAEAKHERAILSIKSETPRSKVIDDE